MAQSQSTKQVLAQALKQLMEKKTLKKITVGDICTLSGMSRKGFYYHFHDKYDLANWIFYSEFLKPASQRDYSDPLDFFRDICEYFYENRAFYIRAFQDEGQNSFSSYLTELLQPVLQKRLEQEFEEYEYAHFYSVFFTDAFRTAIIRWLRENASIKPDEFIWLLRRIPRSLEQDIPRRNPEQKNNQRPN